MKEEEEEERVLFLSNETRMVQRCEGCCKRLQKKDFLTLYLAIVVFIPFMILGSFVYTHSPGPYNCSSVPQMELSNTMKFHTSILLKNPDEQSITCTIQNTTKSLGYNYNGYEILAVFVVMGVVLTLLTRTDHS